MVYKMRHFWVIFKQCSSIVITVGKNHQFCPTLSGFMVHKMRHIWGIFKQCSSIFSITAGENLPFHETFLGFLKQCGSIVIATRFAEKITRIVLQDNDYFLTF